MENRDDVIGLANLRNDAFISACEWYEGMRVLECAPPLFRSCAQEDTDLGTGPGIRAGRAGGHSLDWLDCLLLHYRYTHCSSLETMLVWCNV